MRYDSSVLATVRILQAIALCMIIGCASSSPVPTPPPSLEQTVLYLRGHLDGWSWQTDGGASKYEAISFVDCTLVVTERLILPDGRTVYLDHILPMRSLSQSEWYPGGIDG